jgi:hypothetical protein
MLDSDVIEIALGLIFVFVLFSLLVSAANEVLVGLLGSRARTLWHGVERMLGSAAARQVFEHALVRSVTPPSSWSRSNLKIFGAGSRRGPTYIEARTFATALLDVLQAPHRSIGAIEAELTRTIAELGRGDVSGVPRLSAALGALQLPTPFGTAIRQEVAELQRVIAAGAATAPQVQAAASLVLHNLPAHWRSALSTQADALSADLGKTVRALADNTAGGVVELRQEIERWFDESMDAVSGWYKRWTMWVQVVIGVVLAIALNVDTLRIVQELDRNDALRQALAARAEAYARNESLAPRNITGGASTGTLQASLESSNWKTFTLRLPADVLALKNRRVTATPSSVLAPFKVTCDAGTLKAMPGAPGTASLDCNVDETTVAERIAGTLTIVVEGDRDATGTSTHVRDEAVLPITLVPDPESQFKAIEGQLGKLGLPIGWGPGAVAVTMPMLFGWLLTALAGSLGAPFWFDLLKQVSNLRAAGPNPAEKKG